MGGEEDSYNQFQDSQQSIPAQNFGSEFVNQLRDVILETMEERLQKFKQDMGHQHQSEGEFEFGHESETHGTQQEVTQRTVLLIKFGKMCLGTILVLLKGVANLK